jgi:hypothetical protein
MERIPRSHTNRKYLNNNKMKKVKKTQLLTFFALCFFTYNSFAQPNLDWDAIYSPGATLGAEGLVTKTDIDGNVFVAGLVETTTNQIDAILIKYDNQGIQQWQQVIAGDANAFDNINSIAISSTGDIYAAGIISTLSGASDILVCKYNTNGVLQWQDALDGGYGGDDGAVAIVLSVDENNVYVGGSIYSENATNDFFVAKYMASGILQWTNTYDGTGAEADAIYNIAVDDSNNLYVAGRSVGITANDDILTIKYDSLGNQIWVDRFNSAQDCGDTGFNILVDKPTGDVFVLGWSCNNLDMGDAIIRKLNTVGNVIWTTIYHDVLTLGVIDTYKILMDTQGSLYVGAEEYSGNSLQQYLLLKFDSNGAFVWKANYNNVTPSGLRDIVLDSNDNIYTTGWSLNEGVQSIFTIKYNSLGNLLCEVGYNAPNSITSIGNSIEIDQNNNIYVTGYSTDSVGYNFITTLKYSNWNCFLNIIDDNLLKDFVVYPNPTKGITNISFTFSETSNIVISLREITGKQIRTIYEGTPAKGTFNCQIDLSSCQNGIIC